jgi:serine/threonine-protein kinase HipA
VYVHEVLVGRLEFLGLDSNVTLGVDHRFVFDDAWLRDGRRPLLGQIFEDRRPEPILSSGLPSWFAHILPAGSVRRLVSRWVGLGDDSTDMELLAAIGQDLPGAVTVTPAAATDAHSFIVAQRPPQRPSAFAFGLPGVQMKASYREGDRGFVCPVQGEGGDYIAKFADPLHDRMPEVEHATTRWASLSGVNTHHARLTSIHAEHFDIPEGVQLGSGSVFLARRFDRAEGGRRVHVEDLGQVLGSSPTSLYALSYEKMATVVAVLCPEEDRREWLSRLAFMVVCGNGDAHWKNWGVIYPDGRSPRLSPAYDIVSTVLFLPRDDLALTLGESKAFEDAKPARWDKLARALEMSHAELVRVAREARAQAEAVWSQDRHTLGFDAREVALVERHLLRLPSWGQ